MQRLLSHPITIVLFTVLALIFFISLDKNTQTAKHSATTLHGLETQNNALESDVQQLEKEVMTAQTNLAKEKIIRNELLLQKPGEFIVQLPPEAKSETIERKTIPAETPWQAWKKILL